MSLFSYLVNTLKRGIYILVFMLVSSLIYPNIHSKQLEADVEINNLYDHLNKLPQQKIVTRLDIISAQFIGKPYLLTALGEGMHARFDQFPRYRTDAFDCDTYVTTVLAITLAKDNETFKCYFRNIRYQNGLISFITRNHFTDLDWNRNNQRQGFLKDITLTFKDRANKPIAQMATTLINKPGWYQYFKMDIIRLNYSDQKEKTKRLTELKKRGAQLPKTISTLPYLPLDALFDKKGSPNQTLFSKIPNGAIIEIIRPNWNIRNKIGTNLNISHLGFVFWKKNTPYFRQASSQYGQVVEIPLIDYLRDTLSNPTIKGINVQTVAKGKPPVKNC